MHVYKKYATIAAICDANCSFNDFGNVLVTYEVVVVGFIDFTAADKLQFTQQPKFVCQVTGARPYTERNSCMSCAKSCKEEELWFSGGQENWKTDNIWKFQEKQEQKWLIKSVYIIPQ